MAGSWLILVVAGLLEVGWAVGMKFSDGFTRVVPSLLTLLSLIGSMTLLAQAAKTLPLGTAYAVWVGIGAAGAWICGATLFREPVTPGGAFFFALLLISIVGLKFSTPG